MTDILAPFLLLGHLVMVAFGISIIGIRIAGGMVIGSLGFPMLFREESQITGLQSTPVTNRHLDPFRPTFSQATQLTPNRETQSRSQSALSRFFFPRLSSQPSV